MRKFILFLLSCFLTIGLCLADEWDDFLKLNDDIYSTIKLIPLKNWVGKTFIFCSENPTKNIEYKPDAVIDEPGSAFTNRVFKVLEVKPDKNAYHGIIFKIQMIDDRKTYYIKGSGIYDSEYCRFPNCTYYPNNLFNKCKSLWLNHIVWYLGNQDFFYPNATTVYRFSPVKIVEISDMGLDWESLDWETIKYKFTFETLDGKYTFFNYFTVWSSKHEFSSIYHPKFYDLHYDKDPKLFSRATERQWRAILDHSALIGMSRFQTFLSLGKPETIEHDNRFEIWKYDSQNDHKGFPIGEKVYNSIYFGKKNSIEKISSPESYYENALLIPDEDNDSRNLKYFQLLNLYRVSNKKDKLCNLIEKILDENKLSKKKSKNHFIIKKDDIYSCPLNHAIRNGHIVPLAFLTKACCCSISDNEKNEIFTKVIQNFGDDEWNFTNREGNYGEMVFYLAGKKFCENAFKNKALRDKYGFILNIRLGDLSLLAGDREAARKYYKTSLAFEPPNGSGAVFGIDIIKNALDDDFSDFDSEGYLPSRNLTNVSEDFYLSEHAKKDEHLKKSPLERIESRIKRQHRRIKKFSFTPTPNKRQQ